MGARLHDGGNWESVQGRIERRLMAGRALGAGERRSPGLDSVPIRCHSQAQ